MLKFGKVEQSEGQIEKRTFRRDVFESNAVGRFRRRFYEEFYHHERGGLNKEDFKFARKVMDEFTRKGTGNRNREKISENMAKIESLCSSFSSNINEDQTFVLFAESELTGVPDLKQYKLDEASGKLKVSLKADVFIMQFG